MADAASTFTLAQWIQLVLGGGVAGLLTSFVSTRIEWRRVRNEEAERTSFYEQKLFGARLEAYQELALTLSQLTDTVQVLLSPSRASNSWTDDDRKAIGEATDELRGLVWQLLMKNALLFGPSIDDALGPWTTLLNIICGSESANGLGPNEVFMKFGIAHYAVLQAMRSDLHLGKLDQTLIQKLAAAK